MLHKSRVRATEAAGFTLIELLVVILIIGILASIAVPSFLNQKGKANDAAAKTVVQTAQTAEETVFTDGPSYRSQAVGAGPTGPLNSIEASLLAASAACVGAPPYSVDPCGLVATSTGTGYQVSVTSGSGAVFSISRSAGGVVTRTCDVTASIYGNGGCMRVVGGAGTW